jgi:methyltransferase (TIGR00027 family)
MTGEPPKIKHRGTPGFLIKFFQLALYIPIQVAFIPIAIVGMIDAIIKEMRNSKKLGVSFTAIQALQYRWIMHYFDTRPDPISVAFTKELPCESHFGLWSTFGALIISQRLFGFTTKLGRVAEPGKETLFFTPGRRVLMFDAIVEKYVDEMEQIVIPGVGFDLVALHSPKAKNAKVFELDQSETLRVKVETLKKAGIAHDWITYVPVDYSTESWTDKLLAAGFDKTSKTLFLWESVSLFLEADTVKQTLREMAGLCAGGSIIAQDFYSKAFISGETSRTVKRSAKMIDRMGEPWRFGIDMSNDPESAIASFLGDCGLRMTEYFQLGEKLGIEPFYCIVEAEKLD